ncbi:uncharacterized protein DUF2794 [Dongia mobilis]|uniref:Uncharacterized protein DUF2794 n=1 Tax=Dongia mobilis TaxID=578943 RepID=A0A4R6WSW9_9PROT|nr:DUF2794 domain-containing protein [Dongia mobilis]TDQ83108.1 uncharacterized protein DUF2794 [Dongia mobilis]
MSQLVLLADYRRQGHRVYFNRDELNLLLGIYSRKVAHAVWRDYAIDHRSNMAVFSIFRRTQEQPSFTLTKVLLRGEKEANYVLLAGKRQLKSSRRLADLVDLLDRQLNPVD